MFKKVSIISMVVFLTACSSTNPGNADIAKDNKAGMPKDKNMVCEYTATTGSHRKKRTCMTKELSDDVRRRNQEALRSQEYKGQTSTRG